MVRAAAKYSARGRSAAARKPKSGSAKVTPKVAAKVATRPKKKSGALPKLRGVVATVLEEAKKLQPAEPDDGPARQRLRAYLKAHRRDYPPVLRAALWTSGVCALAMLGLLGVAFVVDRSAFIPLLEFVGLTTISGPQAATFFVFTQPKPPLGLGWVLAMSMLNMLATLCLVVPLAWRGFERLRDARFIGGAILGAERFAKQNRAFLARWGLVGLVLVNIAPVQGAGVLGAGVLGVLMRIPVRRLLLTIGGTGLLVSAAWAIFIKETARVMPTGWWSDLLPFFIVAAVVVVGAAAAWRGRKLRYNLQIESIPWVAPQHREQLKRIGITQTAQLFNANLKRLGRRLGIPKEDLGRCRNAAELLRLNSLSPHDAERLTAIGVASIRDLAVAPAPMVQDAFEEAGRGPNHVDVPALGEVQAWRTEAKEFQLETRRQARRDDASA